MPRKRPHVRLLLDYEFDLRRREQQDEISSVTVKTYMNDAESVIACLVDALPATKIGELVKQQGYKGDYTTVIKALKDIGARTRPPPRA